MISNSKFDFVKESTMKTFKPLERESLLVCRKRVGWCLEENYVNVSVDVRWIKRKDAVSIFPLMI